MSIDKFSSATEESHRNGWPGMEDADGRFLPNPPDNPTRDMDVIVRGIRTRNEVWMVPFQVFPRSTKKIKALPDNVKVAPNGNPRRLPEIKMKQPSGGRNKQNNGSTNPNAEMNGQENKTMATDTERAFSELLLRLKQRDKRREAAYKRRLTANADNQDSLPREHPRWDEGIIQSIQDAHTPTEAWLETAITEAISYGHLQAQQNQSGGMLATKKTNPTNDEKQNTMATPRDGKPQSRAPGNNVHDGNGTPECVYLVDENHNDDSSEDETPKQHRVKSSPPGKDDDDSDDCGCYSRNPDPRGRNGDSSDDDYKEDPFDLWALRQRQLGNKDPQFESQPWSLDGDDRKSERPSWLPAHPEEQLQRCPICKTWAYGSRCYCTTKERRQSHTSTGTPPNEQNAKIPDRVFLVDNNYNVNLPPKSKVQKGVVYLDDDVLPHYEYFDEEENGDATNEGNYLGSDDSDTSDDNGHRECGTGGYSTVWW